MAALTNSNDKLIRSKADWARTGRLLTGRISDPATDRLPPGQSLVRDWPVLDLGNRPNLARRDWRLTVGGLADRRLDWSWTHLEAQPQVETLSDIHCVTGWSRYDNRWRGVSARRLLSLIRPKPEARFVILRAFDGYATCVPLAHFADAATILATDWNGAPLTREHGGPVRLILPRLYLWKSVKWLRHIWLTDKDAPGFWEARGYHRRGDPWREERYGGSSA